MKCYTFLQSDPTSGYAWRIADSLVSRAIEASVILTWHGMWMLTDNLFDVMGIDPLRSALLSIFIGTAGALVIFIAQFPLLCWRIKLAEKEDVDKNHYFVFTNMCFSYFCAYSCINR